MRRPLVWYAAANTGVYALLPPVVVGMILPGGLMLVRASDAPQSAAVYVDYCLRFLIPMIAAWWPLFVFKERIEGDGRELLYLLKRRGEAVIALALALAYTVLLTPFVFLAVGASALAPPVVPLVLARCLFLASLAFWAAFVLRSSPLALVLVLAFNVAGMEFFESLAGSTVPALQAGNGVPMPAVIAYLALSLGMFAHGEAVSRNFSGP